jgi:hypothetical protein
VLGWDLGDGVHEGWATCVSADGRLSHGSSLVGVMVEGITGAYPVHNIVPTWEVVPYAEVIGWRGGCACGWQGQLWERVGAPGLAEVGARRVYAARGDVPGAVEEDIEAEWARHAEPAQAITAVAAAAGAARVATRGLDEAVLTARRGGASWTDIGRGVGITRQSAHQRWGTLAADTPG